MSKTLIYYFKLISIPLFFVSLLFIVMVYTQNGTTMVVTMESSDKAKLQSKIYFSSDGAFSELNSAIPFRQQNNQYYFSLPQHINIKQIRFDPTTRIKNSIDISKIVIVNKKWFKKTTYKLPLKYVDLHHQIENFKRTSKGIVFATNGRDPQLIIHYATNKIYEIKDIHFILLLVSILIYVFIAYIYYIYRTQENSEKLITKLILYGIFFAFIVFQTNYYKDHVKFGYPPDETMHLKYINYVQNNHSIVPDFENMQHYLSHPPMYYELMSVVNDKSVSTRENVNNYRTLSMILYIIGVMLILYLGFSASMGILGDFVYLTFISSLPMHAYLGGSITNDNLAMLGSIVFVLGMKRLIEEKYNLSTYLLIIFGAFIAYFSKLTAALLIFFAVIFFLVRMIYSRRWIKLTKTYMVLIALFLIPILYYQISIMLNYHSLVPTYDVTHPEAYLKSGFYTAEEFRQHLSRYEWFERMLHYIQGGWFGIHSHHSFGHSKWIDVIGLLSIHIFAIFAMLLTCSKKHKTICLIGKITLFALFSVLVVQYFFSYKAHLHSGYMGGLQPRYLLPFMFSFAIMASMFVERFKQYFLFNILIILICIHAIYSDFFYFLQFYQ